MRFEELSYRVDRLPVTIPFHPRLTVVGPLGARARSGWIERVLGVLLGTRPGDGVGLVFVDPAGHRVRLRRDHHGAARITGVGTDHDYTPAAALLPLDGRLDWFATVGLDGPSARALVRIEPSEFQGKDFDPFEAEDELFELRAELARVQAELETALAGFRQAEELYRRVGELDDRLGRLEEERARRRHGETMREVRRLEAEAAHLQRAVAAERGAAEAILAAAEAGEEWLRAADSLEIARLVFGQHRPAPEAEADPEPDPDAAEPATPASSGPGGQGVPAVAADLEAAHQAVEAAERELDRVRVPALAVAARRRLARAQRREQVILRRLGYVSWLAFQMQRIENLTGPDTGPVPDLRLVREQPVVDPVGARDDRARDVRLRQALAEAESACRAAQDDLEALLANAGLLPRAPAPDVLANLVAGLSQRAAEAAVARRMPPTSPRLREVEAELARARAEVAAHGRPDWDEHPEVSDTLLPDPEPLLEERARLFEQAYRLELQLPGVRPYEDQQATLSRRIAQLDAAARAGFQQKTLKEAEMVLLDRVAQARRVGAAAEPIPLLVNDALAAFDPEERQDLLHLLARLAETTQVVYLTEDPVTLEWAAAQAQAGQALVIGAAPPSAIASVAERSASSRRTSISP